MSMNPLAEDFERLAIRWADTPQAHRGYPSILAAITAFPELYAKNRDALPQNDADRAFALMARAATALDRSIVTAETDEAAERVMAEAAGLLDEALKLDPTCYDAVRIRRYLARPSRDEMASFLAEEADTVCEVCTATSRGNGIEPPQGRLSLSVYMRPYLRWLFDLANEELGCGRYRRSLATCMKALELDVADAVGARHVAAYDYAKLEDAEGLAALIARFPDDADGAWFLLARCFMAYKQRRLDDAAAILHRIVKLFPQAGCTLSYQEELPAGMFGHLEYAPGSADELYVAVSEGAVVLDENCGDYLSALSDWVARDAVVDAARAAEEARMGRTPAPGAPGTGGAAPAAGGTLYDGDAFIGPNGGLGFEDVTCVDDLLAAFARSSGDDGDGAGVRGPAGPDAPAGPDGPVGPASAASQNPDGR